MLRSWPQARSEWFLSWPASRQQAAVVYNYARGFLEGSPILSALIETITASSRAAFGHPLAKRHQVGLDLALRQPVRRRTTSEPLHLFSGRRDRGQAQPLR